MVWCATRRGLLIGASFPLIKAMNSGQCILDGLYATGQGVERDFVQAYKWLALSQAWASQTNQRDLAAEGLARAEAQLTHAQLEEGKRLVADWNPSQP
jgi:TPR repeat protein